MGDKRHLLIGANTTHRNYSSSRFCRLSTLKPLSQGSSNKHVILAAAKS